LAMNAKNWSGIDDWMFTDQALVEQARHGDQEAFGELVRRHRAKAFGWAASITRDDFTAEDIVQDALIRAFLHLSKLLDSTRFVPWLQRIVYNQAYTKLRRGGPYRYNWGYSTILECIGANGH
jgi:RNA polymerase sigma factor (sigma-70 family)